MKFLNKKGIFFTFITILLLLVILAAFIAKTSQSYSSNYQKEESKILTINSFVKSFDSVASKVLEASAKQAIYSSQKYMSDQATENSRNRNRNRNPYITQGGNYENSFSQLIIDGRQGTIELDGMQDTQGQRNGLNIRTTLYQLQQSVKANNGIILEYQEPNPGDISIIQISPWELEVTLTLRNVKIYYPKDSQDTNPRFQESNIRWDLSGSERIIKTKLYVTDFLDPLRLAEEAQIVKIKKTLITRFTKKSDLDSFISNNEFLAHQHGPNFLQRMSGDFSDDSLGYGIESVLDPTTHTTQKSAVDYIYFSPDDPVKCQAQGYSNLYLDNAHAQFYTGLPCPAP